MGALLFKRYRIVRIVEAAPWAPDVDMTGVDVAPADAAAGSPKPGDMIARDPRAGGDPWLEPAERFADIFEPVEGNR